MRSGFFSLGVTWFIPPSAGMLLGFVPSCPGYLVWSRVCYINAWSGTQSGHHVNFTASSPVFQVVSVLVTGRIVSGSKVRGKPVLSGGLGSAVHGSFI